jgi:hypothetical protein
MNSDALAPENAMNWAQFLVREGLPLPPFPSSLAQHLRPLSACAFATSDGVRNSSLLGHVNAWLTEPAPPQAWVGIVGHGLRSMALRVCWSTPEAGFFVQRMWSVVDADEGRCLRRIGGAFQLLEKVQLALERAKGREAFPAGARLVLVDDDFTSMRWGWVAVGTSELPALSTDSFAYIRMLNAVEALSASSQPFDPLT